MKDSIIRRMPAFLQDGGLYGWKPETAEMGEI